jgi:Tfp pilus assembly protein PilV
MKEQRCAVRHRNELGRINSGESHRSSQTATQETGSSIVEVLVSILITGVVGMGLSQSTSTGYKLLKDSRDRALVQQVVTTTLEQLSLSDPSTLTTTTYSQSVSRGLVTVTQTISITTNADRSVSLLVTGTIGGENSNPRATTSMSTRLTPWRG